MVSRRNSFLRWKAELMSSYEITDHHYDVVVVGAGGAGLRATLGMAASGLKTATVCDALDALLPNGPELQGIISAAQSYVVVSVVNG